MATLYSATLDLAKIVGNVIESVTSGAGTTATLVDSGFPRTAPPDDSYNNGTLWFISGALAGKTAVVTDWDQAPTPTFTFATQTAAPGAASRYAFCDKDWPRDVLRNAINSALQTIGGVLDTYTLAAYVTVANQEAYALPTGVYNVKRVEIATTTSAPYYYKKHEHWTEKDGSIYLDTGFEETMAGYGIRLTYVVQPSELDDDADTISSYIHPDLLKWTAASYALSWRPYALGDTNALLERRLSYALQMEEIMRQRHRLPSTVKDIHLSPWAGGESSSDDGGANRVRL